MARYIGSLLWQMSLDFKDSVTAELSEKFATCNISNRTLNMSYLEKYDISKIAKSWCI